MKAKKKCLSREKRQQSKYLFYSRQAKIWFCIFLPIQQGESTDNVMARIAPVFLSLKGSFNNLNKCDTIGQL